MSVQRECVVYESKPNSWYLLLAMREYGRLEDTMHSIAVGPFSSEEKAEKYLFNNYSNPGSVNEYSFGESHPKTWDTILVKNASRPSYNNFGW